jgi:hypothetical protein
MILSVPAMAQTGPSTIGWCREAIDSLPMNTWALPAANRNPAAEGGGCGGGWSAVLAAGGEFAERAWFFNQAHCQPADCAPMTIGERLAAGPAADWQRALQQIAEPAVQPTIASHHFRWRRAWHLFSGNETWVPEVVVSLRSGHPDRAFCPVSDSCACACHPQPTAAIQSAVLEWCERQALLSQWLAGHLRHELDTAACAARANDPSSQRIIQFLATGGRLRLFDIGLWPEIPVILALFQGNAGNPVQFVTAAAAGISHQQALAKVLCEAWQSYRFMLISSGDPSSANRKGDLYEESFLAANLPTSAERFAAWANTAPPIVLDAPRKSAGFPWPAIRRALPCDPILFQASAMHGGKLHLFCKVLSPQSFLNLSPPHSNVLNTIVESFGFTICPNKSREFIPFP